MSDDSGGSGTTVQITDSYLTTVVVPQLESLMDDIRTNPIVSAIQVYASSPPNKSGGLDPVSGKPDTILPGGAPMTSAVNLQAAFQQICWALSQELQTFSGQLETMANSLQRAESLLDNAANDTDPLSADQLWQLFSSVYQQITPLTEPNANTVSGGSGNTGSGSGNTNSNSNTANTNSNSNSS